MAIRLEPALGSEIQFLDNPQRITEQSWPEGTVPLLSIFCPTYNHAPYISACIDSFLAQETTFPVEIIIHDDASTDGTTEILRDYESKYPFLFRNIIQMVNLWPNTPINLAGAASCCRGRFVATCEGDDYWTAADKVEQQLQFLLRNPACLVIGNRSMVHRQGDRTAYAIEPNLSPEELCDQSPLAILQGQFYLPTHTRMFPRSTMHAYIDAVGKTAADCDWLFMLHCLSRSKNQMGTIVCLNDVMGVYRVHAGGIWSSRNAEQRRDSDIAVLKFALENFLFFPEARTLLTQSLERHQQDFNSVGVTSSNSEAPCPKKQAFALNRACSSMRVLWRKILTLASKAFSRSRQV